MSFRPVWRQGPLVMLAATAISAGLAAWTLRSAQGLDIGLGAFALLVLAMALVLVAAVLVLYTVGFWFMSYRLDRNGLTVTLQPMSFAIPMEAIEGLFAAPAGGSGPFRGLRFRGHNVGYQSGPRGRWIIYLATAAPQDCLYVQTANRIYAISPAERGAFLRQYESERSLGPVRHWQETLEVLPVLRALWWRDHLGLTLAAAALVAGFVLLAEAFWRFPSLPDEIPMHFDALGRPDRLVPAQRVFYLPLIGSIVILANSILAITVYRRERALSYYLWGGAVVVQVLLLGALHAVAG